MTSLLPFTTDIIRAFGWTLLHSFWQAFVVFACLRIVLKIWPAASSAAKYHLSFLSLAGIFTWFVATFWQQMLAIRESQLVMHFVANNPLIADMQVAQLPAAAPANNLKWLFPGMEVYFPVLVGIYVVGVAVMTIKLVLDLAQLQQVRRAAMLQIDTQWEKQLKMLATRLGVNKKVQLHISSSVQVPVMIGFIRPLILLPAAMINNLSTDQLEAILLHELAHIKRHDYLLNIFQTIVETILFFNPFIWWISKNIRIEREHCCDDLVIASTVQPLHYAKALVALEEYRLTTNPMAMAIADNKQFLFHRIKRIMEMKTSHRNYSQQLLALLIILTGVASIAWLNPSQKEKKVKQPQKKSVGITDSMLPVSPISDACEEAIVSTEDCAVVPAPPGAPKPPLPLAALANIQAAPINIFQPLALLSPLDFPFDTLPKKIRIKDSNGNIREYNSIKDMPEEDRERMQEQFLKMQETQEEMRKTAEEARKTAEKLRETYKDSEKLWKDNSEHFKKAYEEAGKALKEIDWAKHNKEIAEAYKNIDWATMNENIQKAYKEIDWKTVNENALKAFKDINWEQINGEMRKALEQSKSDIKIQEEMIKNMPDLNSEEIQKMIEKTIKHGEEASKMNEYQIKAESDRARQEAESARKEKRSKNDVNYNELGKELQEAKLINSSQKFDAEKKNGVLYIDGAKQSPEVLKKYARYFKGRHVHITQNGDNLSVSIND
ncbi:M56 family metallopeptidase [uncultured Chitinophaga sp.]|uniref:M56 family metallopeptidase n=1 Tax=uncultured Chitinophaga sp. TaxID=339340 RepID=UPI0025FD807F|nr:M56 family metallopeptidase [uncultured Chitinophaga sp.]